MNCGCVHDRSVEGMSAAFVLPGTQQTKQSDEAGKDSEAFHVRLLETGECCIAESFEVLTK